MDDTLEDTDWWEDVLVLATCEAEPLKLWLPAELADELDPPEEPPCEPPELAPPPPEECCARRVAETNRMAATNRPESRMVNLSTD
jgi:hypothetical protein